jgi:lipopolysaccharide export system protein LptC
MINRVLTKLTSLPRLPLAVLILLVAATFWLDKVVQPSVTEEDGTVRRDPDYMLEGLSVIRTDQEGVARYKLFAKKMLHYSDDDSTHLEHPHLVNAAPGKSEVQINADRGEISGGNDDVNLSGNVILSRNVGTSSNRATLITSSLLINPDGDIARTDKAVTIKEGGTTINAVGMELDSGTNVTRLMSQVRVVHDKER